MGKVAELKKRSGGQCISSQRYAKMLRTASPLQKIHPHRKLKRLQTHGKNGTNIPNPQPKVHIQSEAKPNLNPLQLPATFQVRSLLGTLWDV